MNDFAPPISTLPHRPGHRCRPVNAASVAMFCLLLTATGCSTLRGVGNTLMFWRDDPAARIMAGDDVRPEDAALVLGSVAEQMRLDPTEPYWPFHMGELYAALDSTARAEVFLQGSLELDGGYAPAAALLSKIYYDAQQYEDGIALLDGFIAGNAGAPDALRAALALHLEALGDVDAANAVLDGCSGNSKEARAARTFVTLRGSELESVLETAQRALDDDPRSAANHNNYGIALLFAGRPTDARKAFLSALKLNEALPGALYNMAIVETFYFFDEEAGRQWFARYKQYASDDPDDLASVLGAEVSELKSKP